MNILNHKFELAARPVGMPKRSDWKYVEEPVRDPREGELLVRVLYVSLDPAMRGWMNEGKSYIPAVGIGEVMRALALGRILASRNSMFAVGDYVYGPLGIQEFALTNGNGLTKVDPSAAPLPVYLSTLGMPGMTAYFGLLEVGQPKPGETVVVSGAAAAEGAIFKRDWMRTYREAPQSFQKIILSWDTAFKTGAENDYSVLTNWGVTENGYFLLSLWRGRVEFPELKRQVSSQAEQWKPHAILVEDKASGQSLIQELKLATRFPVLPIKVDSDKRARAEAVTPLSEAGRIFVDGRC